MVLISKLDKVDSPVVTVISGDVKVVDTSVDDEDADEIMINDVKVVKSGIVEENSVEVNSKLEVNCPVSVNVKEDGSEALVSSVITDDV